MSKTKYPRADALKVAKELCDLMKPLCERLVVAGSLRRRKPEVGDVEILFIPQFVTVPDGLFDSKQVSRVDALLEVLMGNPKIIDQRRNVNGSVMWGVKNKLAVHVASGIPVDFFAATEANWFNYLVCRTGGAENNTLIASTAQAKRWKWNPYGEGFTDERGNLVPVKSEREVFDLLGMEYKEPWERL
jgi:DNA polymerase/3'-5' exonuclease PolX